MNWFSTVGLVIDMIGAVIIFYNGIPFDVRTLSSYTEIRLKEDAEEKFNHQNKYAKIGLRLLLLGFFVQLIGTLVPLWQYKC
jgi:hypothetical protein